MASVNAFPKTRMPLPQAYAEVYERHYKENRSGGSNASSLAQKVEGWMHHQVARDAHAAPRPTLEIGAGTLNQLPFEPANPAYDIIEPMAFLYEDSPHRNRVRNFYGSIDDVPDNARYGRITSVAVLEHLCDLPQVLKRAAMLLEPDGTFRAAIPSEGGFLWWLGWRMTTGLEFRMRYGLDYGVLMRHEHVNTAAEIEAEVAKVFSDVKVRAFGLGRQLSLYRFIEARHPRT